MNKRKADWLNMTTERGWSQKFKRFVKATQDHYKYNLSCDGIDASIYREEWKGLKSIAVETMDVQIWPYSLDYECDAIRYVEPVKNVVDSKKQKGKENGI